jgi:hypothetical protein
MRFNPSTKSKNFGNVDYNGRYVILNHHSGELRLFHRNLKRFPIFNPKFSIDSSSKKPPQILCFEQYFPFDYGRKEYCTISKFLPEAFTRNIRRNINEFNHEVLLQKKLCIKESYDSQIRYLRSLLHSNISNHMKPISELKSDSLKKSGNCD